MFTGIIEEIGVITRRSGADLAILAKEIMSDLHLGDSVAIDGVCLTVAALNHDNFVVQVSPETFSRTTLRQLKVGHAVNLERAMRADARFGGHFVLGHVDGVGKVEDVKDQGDFALWRFRAPAEVARYLVPKGSIAVNGISLTIVDPERDTFGVAIIPATLSKTTLSGKHIGDPVNLEADVLGKHVYHYLKGGSKEGITPEFLARCGFA